MPIEKEANNLPVDEVFKMLVERANKRDEQYRKEMRPYTCGDAVFPPRMMITRGGFAKIEIVILDRPADGDNAGLVFKVQLGLGSKFVRKMPDGRLALTGEIPDILKGPARLIAEPVPQDEEKDRLAMDELVIRGARWRITNWSAVKADLVPVRSPTGGFAVPVRKLLRIGGETHEYDRVSVTLRTGAGAPSIEQTGAVNPSVRLDK